MNLNTLPKIVAKEKRRLGQGHGSGRVKTGGRGTKGQKARGRIPIQFEGGALPLTKRLPFLRGKGKNTPVNRKETVVSLSMLGVLPKNSKVNEKLLVDKQIISIKDSRKGVKIVGNGEITIPLTVVLPVSKSAKVKIEKAGGTISV